jgi:SWI/SNF related-matrix-associated actin-dependent regulator of chromatin subfamily C
MAKSASEALGAAAVKAKLLANQEEREVHKETNALLDQQAKKVEAKVSLLEQITTALSSERDAVDAEKQQIMNERVQLQQQRNELASKLRELQAQQQQQQQQYSQPPPPAPMEFGQQQPPH